MAVVKTRYEDESTTFHASGADFIRLAERLAQRSTENSKVCYGSECAGRPADAGDLRRRSSVRHTALHALDVDQFIFELRHEEAGFSVIWGRPTLVQVGQLVRTEPELHRGF